MSASLSPFAVKEIAIRRSKEEKKLFAHFNNMLVQEGALVIKNCQSDLKQGPQYSQVWFEALYVGLALISGRSIERVIGLPLLREELEDVEECFLIENKGVYISYQMHQPRQNIESILEKDAHQLLFKKLNTEPFLLPVPEPFSSALRKVARLKSNSKNLFKGKLTTIPKKLRQGSARVITKTRLESCQSYYLRQKDISAVDFAYLTGAKKSKIVQSYYGQSYTDRALVPYHSFLFALGLTNNKIPAVAKRTFGSALQVKKTALSEIFKKQREIFHEKFTGNYDDYLTNHNEVVSYVWYYIQLSTGMRPSKHGIGHISNLSHKQNVLYINDKDTHRQKSLRADQKEGDQPIPRLNQLCLFAQKQIENYINYLRNFADFAIFNDDTLFDIIDASLNGDEPLLFLLDKEGRRRPVSESNMREMVQSRWPIPQNFIRHFFISEFSTSFTAEFLNGWIGHNRDRKQLDEQYSGFSLYDLKIASEKIQRFLFENKLLPLNPCKKLSDRSSDHNTCKIPDENINDDSHWNLRAFSRTHDIERLEKIFIDKMSDLNQLSDDTLTGLIVYSAITRGALSDPKYVEIFHQQLLNKKVKFSSFGNLSYVQLTYEVKTGAYNAKEDFKELALRKKLWPIDIQTLILLYHFNKRPAKHILNVPAFEHVKAAFDNIALKRLRNIKQLCKTGYWISSFKLGADISYSLSNAVSFKNINFSLNEASLISISSEINAINWSPYVMEQYKKSKSRSGKRLNLDSNDKWLIKKINSCFADSEDINQLVRNFDQLSLQQDIPDTVRCLMEWLVYKGQSSTVSFSSLISYKGTILKRWVRFMKDNDCEQLTAEEFRKIYAEMLDHVTPTSTRSALTDRLRWIHLYGVEAWGWNIDDDLRKLLKSSKLSFVMTNVIDYRHINNVLEAINKLKIPKWDRTQLKLITLLGFKSGLRISEILKLRIGDILDADEWIAFVKGNKYAGNKNDYSLRNAPILSAMNEPEKNLFIKYFRRCKSKKGKDLLFGANDENIMLDKYQVSRLISNALRQSTSNKEIVFHSTRHCYISYMQLILENHHELASRICGLSIKQCEKLRTTIVGHENFKRDIYYELSRLAGHKLPDQSLQTYTHFCNEIFTHKMDEKLILNADFQASLISIYNIRPYEFSELGIDGLRRRLCKKFKNQYSVRYNKPKHDKFPIPDLTDDIHHTMSTLRIAVRECEYGKETNLVAQSHSIPVCEFERIMSIAERLAETGSKGSGSKFFTSEFQKQRGIDKKKQALYAPDPPEGEAALDLMSRLFVYLIEICRTRRGRNQAIKCCSEVLKMYTANKDYYLIKEDSKINEVIEFFNQIMPNYYWSAILLFGAKSGEETLKDKENKLLQYWQTKLPNDVTFKKSKGSITGKHSSNKKGVLNLKIAHSGGCLDGSIKQNMGVKILSYVAYMTILVYAKIHEVEKVLEEIG